MISVRKAWKMAICDKCDMKAVKVALSSIEFNIKISAKHGKTNLKKCLLVHTSEKRLYATYAKVLHILRRKGYKANIQTETEYDIELADCLFGKHNKPMVRMLSHGTYLYISWENISR